jgi:hypothetical protein
MITVSCVYKDQVFGRRGGVRRRVGFLQRFLFGYFRVEISFCIADKFLKPSLPSPWNGEGKGERA